MLVTEVRVDSFRSLEDVSIVLGDHVTAVHGPNGSGKTNLTEALYFAFTARSFRTADRRDLVPFGGSIARVRAEVQDGDGLRHEFMSSYTREDGSRSFLDGAVASREESSPFRPAIAVFSPDRLEIVKGPPAVRRSHLDAFVAARWPARSGLRSAYGKALAQRNALLAAISDGNSSESQLDAWDAQLARLGGELSEARNGAVQELAPGYREASGQLGLEGENDLAYRSSAGTDEKAILTGLAERRTADIAARRTTWGPHHDELRLELNGRQLRRFGSQGQQRLGLLSLMFAERMALVAAGRPVPLLVLDDVMSELDGTRRASLIELLGKEGQALITAAEKSLVPEADMVEFVSVTGLHAGAGGVTVEVGGQEDGEG